MTDLIPPSQIVADAVDDWGRVFVVDKGNERSLHFHEDSPQSTMWLDSPFDLAIEYTQLMMAGLLFVRPPSSVILFGLGGGSIAKFLWQTFPRCEIHIVELRPLVVEWAHRYFSLPKDPRIQIHTADAIEFVQRRPLQLFDFAVVDLFTENGMSEKLAGHDFFELCNCCLSPQGVLTWNTWQDPNQPTIQEAVKEMALAFGEHLVFLPSRTENNLTILALPQSVKNFKYSTLKTRAEKLNEKTHLNFPFLMRAYNNFI